MSRIVTVGGAQMKAEPWEGRGPVVQRMIEMMREAKAHGCDLIVYPELALTPFFALEWVENLSDADCYYEKEMPGPETLPLFEEAKKLGIGFNMGYAEMVEKGGRVRRFNTSIIVDKQGNIVGKYRKVHLPGHAEYKPDMPYQGLEKYYFEVGDLGFDTWRTMGGVMGMCICNDRRWTETYRVMGLKGVELIMVGYNTPNSTPWDTTFDELTYFHNHLVMQAGAYQNSTYVVGVGRVGRTGPNNAVELIGGSAIIAPSGEMIACAASKEDELIVARCDLDLAQKYKQSMFNFEKHRRIEHYGLISAQTGSVSP